MQQNPAYLTVIVLARVVTRLGSLPDVNTKVVEGLFASDLNYLQKLYEQLNLDQDLRPPSPRPTSSPTSARRLRVVGER